jgi:hypothetical protein
VTEEIRSILKLVALATLGLLGFYGLTRWAAPAHDQAAVFVGLLLTGFGAAFAKFAMELLVLPLGIARMILRVLGGNRPVVINRRGSDPLDVLGRVVFVATFAALAGGVGIGVGMLAGGAGFFAAGLAFAAFGAVLALLVPAALLWATEGSNGSVGMSDQQRADAAAGRRDGDPVVRSVDRIVGVLRDTLVEDERDR